MNWLKVPLALLAVLAAMGAACNGGERHTPPLKEVFRGTFLVGAALNDAIVSGDDPQAAEIVAKHFNTVTSENAMKWENIHPGPETYNFAPSDRFVAFGRAHGMFIVGHTLVWQSQIPDWAFADDSGRLLDRGAMLARMREHIAAVVGRYRGKVGGWDVVNEAFTDEGPVQRSKWVETIGEDYIEKAFEYAHEADPEAELYYNDYSLDKPAKRDAVVRLVRQLKAKGLRIDGVGIQGHWGMDYPTRGDFDAFVDSTAAAGVKVMITEMDVDILPVVAGSGGADVNLRAGLRKDLDPYPDGLPEEKQQELAGRYAELFSMILGHTGTISRVTFWGVTDRTSWLNNWPVRGRTSYPLLFDREYRPKPAFDAVVNSAGRKQ